jgi:hypothetical protein
VFIGARRQGPQIIVSREITRRSPSGPSLIVASHRSKLPKKAIIASRRVSKNWMQNPQLGEVLKTAFAKAVKAAKRQPAKFSE